MLPADEIFQKFCDYVLRQWGAKDISVHGQAVRTNNSVESFHRYFFSKVGCAHPNVWAFLTKLKQMEHTKAVQLFRRQNGEEAPAHQRGKYVKRNIIINRAQDQLELDGDVDKFLTALSRTNGRLVTLFEPGNLNLMISYMYYLFFDIYNIYCSCRRYRCCSTSKST